MNGGEFLQTSHAPKAKHRSLSSSKRQVRILCPVVQPVTGFLTIRRPDFLQCSAIGAQLVRDENVRPPMPLHCFLQEFQGCFLVARLGNEAFKHLAFVIDGPPQVVAFAIDPHEHLVEVPSPSTGSQTLNPALPDLRGKHRAETAPPKPNRFMADFDAAFVQQILNIAERQREPNVQHHRQANDFRAALKALERVRFGHVQTLRGRPARLNRNLSDKTPCPAQAGFL